MDDFDGSGFINAHHANEALQRMDHFLRNKQLCDVTLVAGNRRITAHKLVLCSLSDYFASMFTHDLCEAKKEEIEIHSVNPDALMWLVRYMYTSHIDIREDNVEDLLITARLLQLEKVVEACCAYLRKQLHPSNCLGIAAFADSQGCPDLYRQASCFINENFVHLSSEQEYLELSETNLRNLIESDDITVPDEACVFEALMTWINHDVENRKQSIVDLLNSVRLTNIQREYLCNVVEPHPAIRENPTAQRLVIETMKLHICPLPTKFEPPRKSTLGYLMVVGGMDSTQSSKGCNTIELLDPLQPNEWLNCGQIKHKRVQFGVAVVADRLFIVGGRDGYKTLNSVECYNFNSKSWQSMPPLSTHRHGVGVVLLDGPLYAIGGNDGWSFLNTVERWDSQVRSWNYVAPMNAPRSTHGVAVLGKKIYAIGGRDNSTCLRSVESFDPHFNRWSHISPMNRRRGGLGVAVLRENLFAVGGHDQPGSNQNSKLTPIESAEKYCPESDQWTLLPNLTMPREGVSCGVLGDTLYAVGGYDGKSYLKSVECISPFSDEKPLSWKIDGFLSRGRSATSVLPISQRFCLENENENSGDKKRHNSTSESPGVNPPVSENENPAVPARVRFAQDSS